MTNGSLYKRYFYHGQFIKTKLLSVEDLDLGTNPFIVTNESCLPGLLELC